MVTIFNKMIEENFLNLEKGMSIQVERNAPKKLLKLNIKIQSKEMALKAARRNC